MHDYTAIYFFSPIEDEEQCISDMARKHVQSLTLDKIVVESRASDHFINATQLCKAGNKLFKDWTRLESTKELINALQTKLVHEGKSPPLTNPASCGCKTREFY